MNRPIPAPDVAIVTLPPCRLSPDTPFHPAKTITVDAVIASLAVTLNAGDMFDVLIGPVMICPNTSSKAWMATSKLDP